MINVLVVEDEENIRNIIKKVLEREGYHIYLAATSMEGLDIIDKVHIDLIVLDLMLPDMDGYQFTKELRDARYEIPILMATAKQLPEDKRKGFLVGTDDYMTKPLDMEEFVLRIKALLRRSKIVNERKIVIGKVTIDYDSLTVTRENESITLPQKEFYLLYKLLSYPDKIFTRVELMDEIWGYESTTDDTTLNVHINRLRKKFENYKCNEFVFLHGDNTFSNMMLDDETMSPVLIDPRGYFGYTEMYGDVVYDWAKLYYSIVGNYDQFNLKRFRLQINENDVMLDIESNHWEAVEDYYLDLIKDEVDKNTIKLIHAIIWLSLTTYAWEDYDSICGAFYNGLYYLEEVL